MFLPSFAIANARMGRRHNQVGGRCGSELVQDSPGARPAGSAVWANNAENWMGARRAGNFTGASLVGGRTFESPLGFISCAVVSTTPVREQRQAGVARGTWYL